MERRLFLLALLGLLALGYAAQCPKHPTSPGREILCYSSTYDIKTLDDSICSCTTLVHQGHDLKDLSISGIAQLQKSLKDSNPALQFLLSINDNEGSLKTSAQVRLEAAARIVRTLNEVDGVELNVTAGTKERLVHFVQGLKAELIRKSKDKRIVMVLPTKPQDLAKQFDLKALSKFVDLFSIPTHYLVADDEAFRTFHPSRLMGLFDMLNTDSLVDLVTGLGVEKRKILVSIPANVYKFRLENEAENAPRSPTKSQEPVQIGRSEMCAAMEQGEWIVERDEDLTAPYAFKDDIWIAFEDKISAGIKGKYVLLRELAGLGIYNVEKDSKTKCGISLTEEIYHSFTNNKRKTREAVLTSLHDDIQQKSNPYPSHVKSSEYRIARVVDTDGHVHANRETMHTEFSCPRQGYFVHPKSCNRFYRCVKFNQGIEDYSVFEFDCPAGLAFDERTEVCVWPGSITEGSACPGSSEIAPSKGPKFTCPEHPGYYADPENCRFFYACYDLGEGGLTSYEFRCPYGLVFDEEKLICEWPYLVPSCGGGTYHRKDYDNAHGSHGSGHGGHSGHGGYGGGGYGGSGHGGHEGSSSGECHESGHSGHGESSKGDCDESSHGGHGGSSGGGYDESGHGGYGGSSEGNYDDSGHGNGGSSEGGYGESGHHGHGGSSEGGYDESGHHGHDSGHEGNDGRTTVHSGHDEHGGAAGGGYDHGHTTVHSGHGTHDEHGGAAGGGYDHGHTTVHSGHGSHDGHGGSTGGGYDHGHTTVHSGHSGYDGHGGSTGGGYDHGHTTVHSGHSGYDRHGGSTGGGYDHGHTTVHSGYGGYDGHGGSTGGGYDHGHTTVHSGHGVYEHTTVHPGNVENKHTTIHSGHDGSDHTTINSGHGGVSHPTIHAGHDRNEHSTVHSGYEGGYTHGGGYTGHTTQSGYDRHVPTLVHAGHGGDGESSSGGHTIRTEHGEGHTTTHSGHGGIGHSTIHPEFGGSDAHGGVTTGGYNGHTIPSGHAVTTPTIVHPGYNIHGGSSDSGHVNVHTTGHSAINGNTAHLGSSDGGFTVLSGEGYVGSPDVSYSTDGENSEYSTADTAVNTGIKSGIYAGQSPGIQFGGQAGSTVASGIDNSAGSPLISGNTGSKVYHGNYNPLQGGGYTHPHRGSVTSDELKTGSYNEHTAIGGSQRISSTGGGTYYNKNAGSSGSYSGGTLSGDIITGSVNRGIIGTADSNSGAAYSHGDVSGTIVNGANEQGLISSGVVQPGYVQTYSGAPGYVLTNGVKTTYGSYNPQETFTQSIGGQGLVITGSQTPEVVLTGNSGTGAHLAEHPSPGVIVSNAKEPGSSVIGSVKGQYNNDGSSLSIYDGSPGFSHSQFGGVSTHQEYIPGSSHPSNLPQNPIITFGTGGGYKTNEYHDNGGRSTIRYNNGEITHKYTEDDVREHQAKFGTLPKFDVTSYETSSTDFTKTGPTKTGIVTAQVGGSASYVSGTSAPKPLINPQNIGANAFGSNSGYSGTSSKISNGAFDRTTSFSNVQYTKPRTNYENGRIDTSKVTSESSKSSDKQSASGYTYTKPAIQFNGFGVARTTQTPQTITKQTVYSSSPAPFLNVHVYNNPSAVTESPIGFTTGPLENFKSTVFEAAKIPFTISTVQPVIDTGYKTIISSTQYPININANSFGYSKNTGYKTNSLSTKDNSALNINVSFQPHLPSEEQYETIVPAQGLEPTRYDKSGKPSVTQSVISYQHRTIPQQVNYGSSGFSGYSDTDTHINSTYSQNTGSYGQKITPPAEIYYDPTSTIAPAIGVTYRPPFKVVTPQSSPRVPSAGYNYERPSVKFVSTPSPTIKYQNPIVVQDSSKSKNAGGSQTSFGTSRTEVEKPITNYNRGSTKFTASGYETSGNARHEESAVKANQKSYSNNFDRSYTSKVTSAGDQTGFGYSRIYSTTPNYRTQTKSREYGNSNQFSESEYYSRDRENSDSSSKVRPGVPTTHRPILKSSTPGPFRQASFSPASYGPTTPAITTYSGDYGRGSSTLSYKATTPKPLDKQKGRGKVIVKLSDLHPLLLGKLGAECTCKADPFASFRSGKPLPIDSSRGRIDLSNYDESEVYVDLESSKESGNYDSSEYITSLGELKKSDNEYQTPVIAVFGTSTPSSKSARVKSQRPSSTYLPVESPPAAALKSSRGSASASMPIGDPSIRSFFAGEQKQGGFRVGKSLGVSEGSNPNALSPKGAAFDRFGIGGLRESDETLEGASNCARPGLFRHPNYCNKFYVCHWDEWKKKFTLHVFNCPVHLTFDSEASACNWPSKGPACQDDNLLV
ncbi:filaggrin-2-like [Venturia canescens]|uniref:filaggrin-2-like n=1 Tax=Venturia canescens TaxID=32260 RepID=UPI001C9C1DBA|nr:filaggrin-2-like [Venturia canescens]XP_043281936.1 filaggrin-2-like [Venturia canescens]